MDEVAAAAQPFEDRVLEADFQATDQLLSHPPRVQQKTLVLVGSLVLFVAATMVRGTTSIVDLATLVGVLFVHELGHAIAMLLVGYRDVRIFFIPFFGAAAAGRKQGVARWKQAFVLLAGPLPGIVAGGLALLGVVPMPRIVALQLLIINGLNLLPVVPFDGGQLAQLLLFSRQRHLELVFQALTATALAAFAIWKQLWVIAAVGYLMVITVGHRKRILDVAQRWRERQPPPPDDAAALAEPERRALFRDLWNVLPPNYQARWRGKPRVFAASMQQIIERATQRPPSWSATVGILALWVAALAFAVWTTLGAFALHWHAYRNDDGHFTAMMPGEPHAQADAGPMGTGVIVGIGSRAYSVVWFEMPPDREGRWPDVAHDMIASKFAVVRDPPADRPHQRTLIYREKGVVIVTRLLEANHRAYIITAGAPDEEPDSWRFVDSVEPFP